MKCSIEDCSLPAIIRGWCSKHYTRWKRFGNVNYSVIHHAPKGSPKAKPKRKFLSGGKLEHRIIAARALGRPLTKTEQVHHHEGNPSTLVICPNHLYHKLLHKRMANAKS